jgi:hypothetical protein
MQSPHNEYKEPPELITIIAIVYVVCSLVMLALGYGWGI